MSDDTSTTKITVSTEGSAWEKAGTSQQQAEDPFDYGGEADWIKPPYNPEQLAQLVDLSEAHAASVRTKARQVAGFGFDLVPHREVDPEDPDGRDTVRTFWHGSDSQFQLGPERRPATPTEVLQHAWEDYESVGWYALELLVNTATGKPTGLAHVPAHTIRVRKGGKGFVQRSPDGDHTYFGVAGDRYPSGDDDEQQFVDTKTGDVADSVEEIGEAANELIVQRNYSPLSPHYGTPDVVSALQTLEGDLAARKFNTDFFENNAVPRLAIIVENGELSENSRNEIQQTFQDALKGNDNAHRTVILEAVANDQELDLDSIGQETNDSESVSLRVEPLTVGIDEDASFIEFRDANEHDILQANDVPPVVAGRTEDVNRSTAEVQKRDFARDVIQPKQESFAARLYNIIHATALAETASEDAKNWIPEFTTRGVEDRQKNADVAKTRIEASQGALTLNEARSELGLDPLEGDAGNMLIAELTAPQGQSVGPLGEGSESVEAAVKAATNRALSQTYGYDLPSKSDAFADD